jgi:ABC-2 type transport system ATP-binding protein
MVAGVMRMRRKPGGRSGKGYSAVKTVVQMEALSSLECFSGEGKADERVLKDVNLHLGRPQSWAIYGRSPFEIKLLLEIMANIKPYHDGKCVLVERGMMRHKRTILEHVFYIGDATMLYDNMNTLENLMFATAKTGFSPPYRQKLLFELLLALGLGPISLTPTGALTGEERAVVTLLAALYSDSVMIVFNLPEYDFDEVLSGAIEALSEKIRDRGKTLIFGAKDCALIEQAATHSAYLVEGRVIFQGTVERLRLHYDKILLTIRDENILPIAAELAPLLPAHRLSVAGDSLLISDRGEADSDPLPIYEHITGLGIAPQCIEVNPKTVQNAYEEIDRRYDLQKQLFQ